MICLGVWITCVEFDPASPEEIAEGLLGHVTCDVRGTVMLRPMRVRLLHDGTIRIKVRRGGLALEQGRAVSIDEETRRRVYELILDDPEFRAGMAAIGMREALP